ncbi:helix-turn-helix domain-containing protein [Flavobacterium sp. LT1R49]|uniref:helix-turn-helix domain-containing protein n=1 Tax=Flavobacterium arabinosi TaxID=3398737 RepID=UPI003A87C910
MYQEIDQKRMNTVYQMILEMAEGNFAYRIPRTGNEDEVEVVSVLVNWMAEEMKESAFHAGFVNPHHSYQYVVQSTLIVDNKCIIKDFSGNATGLLGFNPKELLELDFTALLTNESISLWETVRNEILQNESYQTIVSLEFVTVEKLVVPASCSISKLRQSTDLVIAFFSAIIETMKKSTTAKKSFTVEEQKISNYLDVRTTQAVYDYILANMDSPLPTLKELSRLFGTNEYKLKNGFRHLFKMTIQQFYNNERLKRSQLLIQQTKIPLKTIALMAGFSTYPNFSRAFKIKFGHPPTDLKRQTAVL